MESIAIAMGEMLETWPSGGGEQRWMTLRCDLEVELAAPAQGCVWAEEEAALEFATQVSEG